MMPTASNALATALMPVSSICTAIYQDISDLNCKSSQARTPSVPTEAAITSSLFVIQQKSDNLMVEGQMVNKHVLLDLYPVIPVNVTVVELCVLTCPYLQAVPS